jgi:hypothetical protein
MSYGRYLMEQHLGRPLTRAERVRPKDGNRMNYSLGNLYLDSANPNRNREDPPEYEFDCPGCGKRVKKLGRTVRSNWNRGFSGPYCGTSCSSKQGRLRVGTGFRTRILNKPE